jgi:hypothetical protein
MELRFADGESAAWLVREPLDVAYPLTKTR